jgi:hypothetical protein
MSKRNYVHIIMPMGFDPLFSNKRAIIGKAIKRAGLTPRFPDYIPYQPSFDIEELKKELLDAVLILVDLSHERPSCYYELGVAEALGHRAHLIAGDRTIIHQSAGRKHVRFYRDLKDLIVSPDVV